jgi:hypothetical protein
MSFKGSLIWISRWVRKGNLNLTVKLFFKLFEVSIVGIMNIFFDKGFYLHSLLLLIQVDSFLIWVIYFICVLGQA